MSARERRRPLARLLGLVLVAIALAMPGAVSATDGATRLALKPVGQPGPYFDLRMAPGERRNLQVDVANDGTAEISARTYAADVYTIVDGGFGGGLHDSPRTGMSRWIGYEAATIALAVGGSVRRPFTITVPGDAMPGEYISALILENDQPIVGDGAIALQRYLRQAVAVVVTVPGPRAPGLAIGGASHQLLAGRSLVSVAVRNTGNVRLKPAVGFSLFDATGRQLSRASMQMDTFYAHTDTTVEFALASLLTPGHYRVGVTLDDPSASVDSRSDSIELTVEAPTEPVVAGPAAPGLVPVLPSADAPPSLLMVLAVVLGGVALSGVAARWRSRRRRTLRVSPDHSVAGPPSG